MKEFNKYIKQRLGIFQNSHNEIIIGCPGSGKTIFIQKEIEKILQNTQDDVFVIELEKEYADFTSNYNGDYINLSSKSSNYTNLLDIGNIVYDSKFSTEIRDAIIPKYEIVQLLFSIMLCRELTPLEKSVINKVIFKLYEVEHISTNHNLNTFTIKDFYDCLNEYSDPVANQLALVLKINLKDVYNALTHKTNIATNNRFTVFSLWNNGSKEQKIFAYSCLIYILNKVCENYKKRKRTWIFLDCGDYYVHTPWQTVWLQQIWKRMRPLNAAISLSLLEIGDINGNNCALLYNTQFNVIFPNTTSELSNIQNLFCISDDDIRKFKNMGVGEGLCSYNNNFKPFNIWKGKF